VRILAGRFTCTESRERHIRVALTATDERVAVAGERLRALSAQ